MPEILTESFCERCGTRYTFESAAPKRRPLGRVRTLSRGLRNFVLSDETSFAEAMAEARIDEEREASAQQLDAFHKTFNFCMSCRQYTCGNCWNEPEGRCLSCAPHLGTEILPAAFPDLDPHAGIAMPVGQEGSNGHLVGGDWPEADLGSGRLGRVFGSDDAGAGIDLEHDAPVEPVAASAEPVTAEAEPVTAEAVEEPQPETVAEPLTAEPVAVTAEPVTAEAVIEPGVAEAPAATDDEPPPVDLLADRGLAPAPSIAPRTGLRRALGGRSTTPDERAAAAAAQTGALLAKFRPGQSLDAALAAYEEELARARGGEEPAAPEAGAPLTEPAGASGELADVTTTAEPAGAAAPAPEPPVVAEAPARDDIELPVWPTAPATATPQPAPAQPASAQPAPAQPAPAPAAPAQPAVAPPAAGAPRAEPPAPASPWSLTPPVETEGEPQWPAAPQWPTVPAWPANRPPARGDRVPIVPQLAGRPLVPDRSVEALWAASSSEVLARPAGPAPSVQPCVNCGLQLSANARFCRRCGTRQG